MNIILKKAIKIYLISSTSVGTSVGIFQGYRHGYINACDEIDYKKINSLREKSLVYTRDLISYSMLGMYTGALTGITSIIWVPMYIYNSNYKNIK